MAWLLPSAVVWAAKPSPGMPRWLDRGVVEAQEGYATLRWAAPAGPAVVSYRLTEEHDGAQRVAYVEGDRVTVYRAIPGLYQFRLQACLRDLPEEPTCGKPSAPLSVRVGDAWKLAAAHRGADAGVPDAQADGVSGGPDRLRPGLWFNPLRNGHGYSFFWANRLSLPETHVSHGFAYDLLGIWYTHEAKTVSLDGPSVCSLDEAGGCGLVYSDYRPLAAQLRLVQDGDSRYSGGIFVTRGGREVLEGAATITFGADNGRAVIDWTVDFKWERHAASEELVLLSGADPRESANATHYAGIWEPVDGGGVRLVDDIGSFAESVEILFEDALGDPGWIQAVNEGPAAETETALCFYYVDRGYAPDASGTIGLRDSGCSSAEPASAMNRNGSRVFTGFERARAWVRYALPGGLGEVRLGSASAPVEFQKIANFHRILYEGPAQGCTLTALKRSCDVQVTWFTDGDYPRATAFLHELGSDARTALRSPGEIAVVDHPVAIREAGDYRFELRMGDSASSTLMAASATLSVERAELSPPFDLRAAWLDEAARKVRLTWSHPDAELIEGYQVEETRPGFVQPTVHDVRPGTAPAIDLDYGEGPWGMFSYRVRACNDMAAGADCSAWAGPIGWQVADPGMQSVDPAHPWGDNAAGSGSLIQDLRMHYAMGYHFRPETDGRIVELGGYFNGRKTVRLFDRASRALLASARVDGDNHWRYAPIDPVAVEAGREYTVAVYLENSGGSYYGSPVLPATYDGVTILGATYVSTTYDPDAIPVNMILRPMFGQADIGFVPGSPDDDGGPGVPASPEEPPAPAARPDFTIDPESVSVGATRGEFRVDEHGAATYRVPLPVAPGSGGFAPRLALQYSSQAPNDIAGVGWSIAGLSAVTRCPQTVEQDRVAVGRGVSLDDRDRFCLDGQRLMLVAGTHGQDGAEYRTELDGFERIRSFGRAGEGPASFRVWHGDGSFSDYGATPDSRIEAWPGSADHTVFTWALSRRQDPSGNFIDYQYRESPQGRVEAVLDRVRYTGNQRAGTEPYAELRFIYATGRGDIPVSHVRGVEVARDHLLLRIDSVARRRVADAGMDFLRSFFLEYGGDGFGRKVLESVTECSDSSRVHCLPATAFEWLKSEDVMDSLGGLPVGEIFPDDFRGLNIADVNGDGRTDLLIVSGRDEFSLQVAFAEADGGFHRAAARYPIPSKTGTNEPVQPLVIDLDADGFQDLVYPKRGAQGVDWVTRLSDARGYGPELVVAEACCGSLRPRVAGVLDFNGDGLADLLTNRVDVSSPAQGDLVILLNSLGNSSGVGFAPPRPLRLEYDPNLFPDGSAEGWLLRGDPPGFTDATARAPGAVQAFDFNGDGAVDLLARIDRRYVKCDTNCNATALAADGDAFAQRFTFDDDAGAPGGNDGAVVAFYVLFESDGLDRYVQRRVVATDAGTGCLVPAACAPWSHLPAAHQLQAVDVDGDGLADLAWRDRQHDWWYRINEGGDFGEVQPIARVADRERSALGRFVDVTGDGFPEFLYPSATDQGDATWIVHGNDLGYGFGAAERSDILLGNRAGGDIGLLYDFTGDGKTDNLRLDFSNGAVNAASSRLYAGRNFLTGASHEASNVIREIRDGAGAVTRIVYRSMTDPATYAPRHDAGLADWGRGSRVFDLVAPLYLVASVAQSAPTGDAPHGMSTTHYRYGGARAQAGGRGFLGFAEIVHWNPHTGIRSNTRYRQDFPLTGAVADVTRVLAGPLNGLDLIGAPITWLAVDGDSSPPDPGDGARLIGHSAIGWEAAETVEGAGTWQRRKSATVARGWSPDGDLLEKSLTNYRYTSYGRVTDVTEQTWSDEGAEPALTVTTRNRHRSADTTRWILDRVSHMTTEHRRPGEPVVDRSSAFGYDPGTGLRNREVTEPGDAELEVVTEYRLDAFGNRVETSVLAAGVPRRVSTIGYDPLGRFAVREINPYGQVELEVLDWTAAGAPLVVADIDGVVTHSAADPMGRVFADWTETGRWERTVLRHGGGSFCPAGTSSYRHVVAAGEPDRFACVDVLGRTIRAARRGFDGRLIFEDTHYDVLGRPERVSEPYFEGAPRYWNRTFYDALGRITAIDSAAGDDILRYFGRATVGACSVRDPRAVREVNARGQERVEVRNVLGEVVSVVDSLCGRVRYRYDAVGNLTEVVGTDGATVRMSYDGAGRRIAMSDPDKGDWQYAWNGLGELTRQLDAKGQALEFRYDDLGRVVRRLELRDVDYLADPVVTVVNSEETEWQNSASRLARGKARPQRVRYRAGSAGAVIHQRDHHYDALGRVERVVTQIEGMPFTEETTYDEFGRVFQRFDASGDSRGVRHSYNEFGYPVRLQEAREGTGGVVYRTIRAMDERGNVTAMRMGNGVEAFADYDPVSGVLRSLTAYDAMGRELQDVDYLFDSLGNLERRSDRSNGRDLTEIFAYDELNRLVEVAYVAPGLEEGLMGPLEIEYDLAGNITWKSDVGHYRYGEADAGPHAVTRAGGVDYRYDANGNQVSGFGRTLEYSVFDKVVRIAKDGMETRYDYGIAHQRIRRTDSNDIDGRKTTWYLDTVDYVETPSQTVFKRRIADAVVIAHHAETDVSRAHYMVRDHLGSVHNATDESGQIAGAVWMSFDAHGQRRAPDWAGPLSSGALFALNSLTNRGFTGHEHVDALGVINMNGRLYDPRLGRFLQADPLVQRPNEGQGLNRYSYAMNNPLGFTDPSGYSLSRFIKRWGRLIAAIAISVILPGSGGILATSFGITNVYAQAAITGFVAGAVASGSFKGAVIGALVSITVTGVIEAYTAATQAEGLASADDLMPQESTMKHLFGNNEPPSGLYRIRVEPDGELARVVMARSSDLSSGDVLFSNGMSNGFRDAVRNGTSHLHQAGLLNGSYILNFNPTEGFFPDLLEAARDIVGAHTGLTHSSLARDLANTLHQASLRGVTGLKLVGHSQGGAITASALRYAQKAGHSLRSLSGGGVSLHGAPINAWMARTRLVDRTTASVVSRAQFGDAVHVLGGLNIANPLEVLISLYRTPALFSPDASVSPHSLPCGGHASLVCRH